MIDEKLVAELKAKHGDIFEVEPTDEQDQHLSVVVARKSLRVHWDAFLESARDEEQNRVGAMKNFVRDVVVHPDRDELNRRFDEFPGLVTSYFRGISVEAKSQIKVRTKKL